MKMKFCILLGLICIYLHFQNPWYIATEVSLKAHHLAKELSLKVVKAKPFIKVQKAMNFEAKWRILGVQMTDYTHHFVKSMIKVVSNHKASSGIRHPEPEQKKLQL